MPQAQSGCLSTQNNSVHMIVRAMTAWKNPVATSSRQLLRSLSGTSSKRYDCETTSIFWISQRTVVHACV